MLPVFLISGILISVVLLISISVMTYDVEYLFICLLLHLFIFFGELFAEVFGHFLDWVVFLLLSFENSLHILDNILYQLSLQIFSPFCDLSSTSLDIVFHK